MGYTLALCNQWYNVYTRSYNGYTVAQCASKCDAAVTTDTFTCGGFAYFLGVATNVCFLYDVNNYEALVDNDSTELFLKAC